MSATPDANAWQDRFVTPNPEALVAAVRAAETAATHFDELRDALNTDLALRETLGWHGIPWRWSFAYTVPGHPDQTHPLAYLIPEPARPQIALPIRADAADAIGATKLHRSIKDGLANGKLVGDTLWAEWELASVPRIPDLITLLRVIREHTAPTP